MDLTIGSLNFSVDSLGLICLSDSTKSDLLIRKTATIAVSKSLVGSSSKVNLPVSLMTTSIEDRIEELDKIMGNLDLGETMDRLDLNQKGFTTRSGGVSSNIHQLCIIITEAAEENDDADNTAVDTQGNKSRSNNRKEKEKIYVSTEKWRIIMSAINHDMEVPANSRREVLMGYQYALHQHKKKLREEKSGVRRSQATNRTPSETYWDEYSETCDSSKERHREPKHIRRKTSWRREESHARSIRAQPTDEEQKFIQETPEAALVAAQTYLLTT
jgi:hypothetical protein